MLFRDSFRTLPGFRARRARETLCGAGPFLTFSFLGSPTLGSAERGHPDSFRFVPICSVLFRFLQIRAPFRVVETVVLENGRFVPCRKQVVLTKIGGNSDIAFYPQKQGILLLGPRKSTKMTKMAGVTPAK